MMNFALEAEDKREPPIPLYSLQYFLHTNNRLLGANIIGRNNITFTHPSHPPTGISRQQCLVLISPDGNSIGLNAMKFTSQNKSIQFGKNTVMSLQVGDSFTLSPVHYSFKLILAPETTVPLLHTNQQIAAAISSAHQMHPFHNLFDSPSKTTPPSSPRSSPPRNIPPISPTPKSPFDQSKASIVVSPRTSPARSLNPLSLLVPLPTNSPSLFNPVQTPPKTPPKTPISKTDLLDSIPSLKQTSPVSSPKKTPEPVRSPPRSPPQSPIKKPLVVRKKPEPEIDVVSRDDPMITDERPTTPPISEIIEQQTRSLRKRKKIDYGPSSYDIDNDIFDGQRIKPIPKKPRKNPPPAKTLPAQEKLFALFAENQFSKSYQVLVVYNTLCLGHVVPDWHLEQPQRLKVIIDAIQHIKEKFPASGLVLNEGKFEEATDYQLCLAHSQKYLTNLLSKIPADDTMEPCHATQMSQETRDEDRKDTYVSHSSFKAALVMAGGVCHAVDQVAGPESVYKHAFCAGRPPGHHAGKEGHTEKVETQGFCLINNIAIGALYSIDKYKYQRVLIFDFDVHHGNGTEDIVAGNPNVLFISMHVVEIYPKTGDTGEEAADNIIHVPIPNKCSGPQYRKRFDLVFPRIDEFKPDIIFISAGFDAHKDDPTKSAKLDLNDFIYITSQLKLLANKHASGRLISCLEGGYSLQHLALSVQAHVLSLMVNSSS